MQQTTKTPRAPVAPSRPARGEEIESTPHGATGPEAVAPSAFSPPLAYRVNDFCRRLGVSPSTFWKYAALGKIHTIRIGGRTLVPADEAARILREGVQ